MGSCGVWNRFDGNDPHQVLPFYGERVSSVAFTHSAIFESAARPLIDDLFQQGFHLPTDAGFVGAIHTSKLEEQ